MFIGANSRHRFIAELADGTRPFMLVNNYTKEFDLNYVVSNYRYGGGQAAKHLVRLGPRRTCFISGGVAGIPTRQDILQSFKEGLDEGGVAYHPKLILDGWLTEERGVE